MVVGQTHVYDVDVIRAADILAGDNRVKRPAKLMGCRRGVNHQVVAVD